MSAASLTKLSNKSEPQEGRTREKAVLERDDSLHCALFYKTTLHGFFLLPVGLGNLFSLFDIQLLASFSQAVEFWQVIGRLHL